VLSTNALPMIVTHGWPGSSSTAQDHRPLTIPRLTAGVQRCFHLVIPSLPGYGFSGKPTAPGGTRSSPRRGRR
jgi:pimeloyl-ACP methyl ester carboxylesterase